MKWRVRKSLREHQILQPMKMKFRLFSMKDKSQCSSSKDWTLNGAEIISEPTCRSHQYKAFPGSWEHEMSFFPRSFFKLSLQFISLLQLNQKLVSQEPLAPIFALQTSLTYNLFFSISHLNFLLKLPIVPFFFSLSQVFLYRQLLEWPIRPFTPLPL